ncbi:MAG: TrbG/VirB9 family P-type conjugative transfer protein [Oligoflexia bacterium]|nr:TrbG/VirB9 family P-type conjugative transfer protein [Oligoflexia bacterium]
MKRIKFFKQVLFFIPLFILLLAFSSLPVGGVRTVYVDDEKVETINLKVGQATVLSFLEKPFKVNIGNKNYFNLEYVHNDVNIQPLQPSIRTNLFVYGKYHRYGFILKVDGSDRYDDLVKVRWNDGGTTTATNTNTNDIKIKVEEKVAEKVGGKDKGKEIQVSVPLQIPVPTPLVSTVAPITQALEIKWVKNNIDPIRKFHLIDLEITKLQGDGPINLKEMKINVSTESASQTKANVNNAIIREIVYEKDELNAIGEKSRGRIIMNKDFKGDFNMEVIYYFNRQLFKQLLIIKEG